MKISQKLNKELARAVKNFNAKVSRLEKSRNYAIPKKVKITDIKEKIKNPTELRNEIKSLKRFSKRGAEKVYTTKGGLKMTIWERREFGISSRSTKVKMQRELAKLQTTTLSIFGIDTRRTHAQMGSMAENQLKAQIEQISINRFENARTSQDIARLKDLTRKYAYNYGVAKKFVFRENFIEMIDDVVDINDDEREEVFNKLRELTPTQFYDLFSTDEGFQEILLRYKAQQDNLQLEFSETTDELINKLKSMLST